MLRIFLLACLCGGLACSQAPRSLGDLTGPWRLALDPGLWEPHPAAQLRFHAFEKYTGNPVLTPEKEWEGTLAYLYGTVLPEESGEGLRMWYQAYVDKPKFFGGSHSYSNGYAVSRDGFHWTKPDLDVVPFRGSTANNMFLMRARQPGSDHTPNVIHTPWDAPESRYKLINYAYYVGYWGATSADGKHWKDLPKNPILEDPGDVGNFVWDANRRSYIGYPKIFSEVRGFRRRSVGFAETKQFEHWPKTRLILTPDLEDDRWVTSKEGHTDFYGLCAFPYQSLYVGFLWIYRLDKGDERVWPELVYSRDGVHWLRQPTPRTPVVPLGAAGTWDDGMIYTSNHPLIREDKIFLYYGGFDGPHNNRRAKAAIGLAQLRRDGFASLNGASASAQATTKTLKNVSGVLKLNADASAGALRVEVLDALDRPLPGYEKENCVALRVNSVQAEVRWTGHTQLPSGRPVKLRFWLDRAALYSFDAGL